MGLLDKMVKAVLRSTTSDAGALTASQVNLLRQAVRDGYQEGYYAGRADRMDRWRFDYSNNYGYMDGTYGYNGYYVSRNDYRYYFRQGFQRGYQDGYNGRYGPSWLHRWAMAEKKPKDFYAGEPVVPGWVLALAGVDAE